MDRSFNVVFSVLVSALLGLFTLLADSYFQINPMHHGRVTKLVIEKQVPCGKAMASHSAWRIHFFLRTAHVVFFGAYRPLEFMDVVE